MFFYEDEQDLINDIETKTCYSWEKKPSKSNKIKPIYKYAKHTGINEIDLWVENTDRSNW